MTELLSEAQSSTDLVPMNKGLINKGQSCYLNSILQCITYTPPLQVFFKKYSHIAECPHGLSEEKGISFCMFCEIENHYRTIAEADKPFIPVNILSRLSEIDRDFLLGQHEDAHEFFRAVVRGWQSSCLGFGKKYANYNLNPRSLETSFVSQLYGGYLQSELSCPSCGKSSSSFEHFEDLSLEISDVTDSLSDALETFTNPEVLDSANKYMCPECKEQVRAEKRLTIHYAPNVLVIHLKRFRVGFQGKINKKVTFPVDLGLGPFMSSSTAQTDKALYKLYGIVVHLDMFNISSFGHYVAYLRDCRSAWYKLDDNRVEPVSVNTVLKQNAYLLFYVRTSGSQPTPPPTSNLESLVKPHVDSVPVVSEAPVSQSTLEEKEIKVEATTLPPGGISADPQKCLNDCGFFANSACRGYCSQCFGKLFPAEALSMKLEQEKRLQEDRQKLQEQARIGRQEAEVEALRQRKLKEAEMAARAKQAQSSKVKIKRNADCPCGSGLKYKKCHGAGES
eukprot:TRINITY_DN9199_c0_g1_i4.p1 TRINITY_DN9199_c0_g1~~TRINITY_DN9199_c0_g1_i4.p1  ORF type:complete len:585 (+),score=114.01 TRINITY_DN9199_c0_g1_i4:235-1755(+)